MTTDNVYSAQVLKPILAAQGSNVIGMLISARQKMESVVQKSRDLLRLAGPRLLTDKIALYLFLRTANRLSHLFPSRSQIKLKYIRPSTLAKAYRVPIIEVENINSPDCIDRLQRMKPDLIISVFFDQILRKDVLGVSAEGCINVHPSLLPHYRGTDPIFWVLAKGEIETGVTIHKMDESIDAGDIIGQKKISILPEDTWHSLNWKCSKICGTNVAELLAISGNALPTGTSQGKVMGSYYGRPTRLGYADFRKQKRRLW